MTETWMEVEMIETNTLEEFAKINGLTLVVTEQRSPYPQAGFIAKFRGVKIVDFDSLANDYGSGLTVDQAAADYAAFISERRISIHGRIVDVPRLIHSPP